MNRSSRIVRLAAVAVGVLASLALAQAARPVQIEAFGNFKRLAHTGDASAQLALSAVPATAGTYAVGALADLRGEIIVWDGRLLVTRGHSSEGRTEAPAANDAATLLALARATAWEDVPVPADLTQPEFEAFVVREASRRGLDAATPFPFLVHGHFPALVWHVLTGAPGAGHGKVHGQGHAANRVFEERDAAGMFVGFYSGDALEGVISHPGERFHLHYTTRDFGRSGHVDRYVVARGAVLSLPLR